MNGLSGILLYAELLSNIRQISVGCSLSSPGSKDTQALISADGKTLTVRHEGDEKSLQLPAQVKVTGVLPVKQSESLGLSWRLPLATATELARPVPSPLDIQTVPWSASDVCSGCAVKCRKCETTIIEQDAVKVWKDLPSENWAEMMEFWHCHKPDNHDQEHVGDEPHLAGRGYGASSRISGQTGTGFVDLTSFLFSETDCTNLKTVDSEHKPETQPASSSNQGTIVSCSVCSAEIGIQHSETASVTLYKWQITLAFSSDNARTQPDLANCVASMLISTLSRSGCSKSIILPVGSSNSTLSDSLLNIWLFNGNISFTSTARLETETVPAVKILYRFVSKEEAERMSESMTSDVQDITLPASAVDSLKRLLGESSEWLPKDDRKFKEWAVGLLVKWKGLG